jgi:hypothetical protein
LGERSPYRAVSRHQKSNRVGPPQLVDRRIRQMLLYLQTWLPLVTVTLTAAIFFSVASFLMGHAKP